MGKKGIVKKVLVRPSPLIFLERKVMVLLESPKETHEQPQSVIYPSLQMMEDEELINLNEEKNKKIYSITQKGLQILEERKDIIKGITKYKEQLTDDFHIQIQKQFEMIGRVVLSNAEFLTPDKESGILKVLEEGRRRIGQIIFASENEEK